MKKTSLLFAAALVALPGLAMAKGQELKGVREYMLKIYQQEKAAALKAEASKPKNGNAIQE